MATRKSHWEIVEAKVRKLNKLCDVSGVAYKKRLDHLMRFDGQEGLLSQIERQIDELLAKLNGQYILR